MASNLDFRAKLANLSKSAQHHERRVETTGQVRLVKVEEADQVEDSAEAAFRVEDVVEQVGDDQHLGDVENGAFEGLLVAGFDLLDDVEGDQLWNIK